MLCVLCLNAVGGYVANAEHENRTKKSADVQEKQGRTFVSVLIVCLCSHSTTCTRNNFSSRTGSYLYGIKASQRESALLPSIKENLQQGDPCRRPQIVVYAAAHGDERSTVVAQNCELNTKRSRSRSRQCNTTGMPMRRSWTTPEPRHR